MKLPEVSYERILREALPATMVPELAVRFTIDLLLDVIERDVGGAVVECGVWRGGCSIAMLLAQHERFGSVPRKVYLVDSFEGLPPAKERDGPLAATWQADTKSPSYYDNCRASFDEVRDAMRALRLPADSYEIVQGWFDDRVPELAKGLADERIAFLRLDGDWYDSTMVCLEHLVPLVNDEGIVLIDDYYWWDGCARAVHDYLSRHGLAYRIRSLPNMMGAYFVKRPFRADPDSVARPDQAWMRTAQEQQAALDQLETSRAWAEEQGQAWMRTAEERQAALAELETARAWAEEQRQAWMRTAEERQAALAEQETGRAWAEEQRQAWMRTAEERQAALAERETGRAWAEEQRQAWMRTAEERQAALTELETGRAWAEEQRQTWMRTAEERRAALTELETERAWAEEQRQAWMRTAEERQAALTELEAGRAWAEEQRQAWMRTAEERQAALTELEAGRAWAEEQRQAWMRTAEERQAALSRVNDALQQALATLEAKERWAEELVRVRDSLETQRDAQAATITRQSEELAKALARADEALRLRAELDVIIHSPGYRLLQWSRDDFLPPNAWRGRVARSFLRQLLRLFRPSNP